MSNAFITCYSLPTWIDLCRDYHQCNFRSARNPKKLSNVQVWDILCNSEWLTYVFWQFVWIPGTHVSYSDGVLSICVSLIIPAFFQSSIFITDYLQALPTAFSFLTKAMYPTRKKVLVKFRASSQLTLKSILFIFYNSLKLYFFSIQFGISLVHSMLASVFTFFSYPLKINTELNAAPFNSIDSLRSVVLNVKRKIYYYLYFIFGSDVNRCIFFKPRGKKVISDCWVVLIICSGTSVYTKLIAADNKCVFFEEIQVLCLLQRNTCKAEDRCSTLCLAPSQRAILITKNLWHLAQR